MSTEHPIRGRAYVDDAFCSDDPNGWGKWTGGGHLQADSLDDLHAFAARLGMRREWFRLAPDDRSETTRPDAQAARRSDPARRDPGVDGGRRASSQGGPSCRLTP